MIWHCSVDPTFWEMLAGLVVPDFKKC